MFWLNNLKTSYRFPLFCPTLLYLFTSREERKTEVFHLLVHSFNVCTVQAWARPPAVRSTIQVSCGMDGGGPIITAITCCFQACALAGSRNGEQSWDLTPGVPGWDAGVSSSISSTTSHSCSSSLTALYHVDPLAVPATNGFVDGKLRAGNHSGPEFPRPSRRGDHTTETATAPWNSPAVHPVFQLLSHSALS